MVTNGGCNRDAELLLGLVRDQPLLHRSVGHQVLHELGDVAMCDGRILVRKMSDVVLGILVDVQLVVAGRWFVLLDRLGEGESELPQDLELLFAECV